MSRRSLRIAFHEDTDLGRVSCLASIPVEVCARCGATNWNRDAETITEDAVRREYVKLLSARRRSSDASAAFSVSHSELGDDAQAAG